ncbi:MAG: ABC transporter ATP-binding protein [Bryobacterales bacterium]|nr:ABC transporter ATP-binding protein [Bryobacterales bacterium]
MNNVALRVDRLSKRYRIGARQARYRTLRESITDSLTAPFRALKRTSRQETPDVLWALRDVSFEIPRGEVIGVIGRNGAGKSTLLKVLSRITEPSEGGIDVYGRIGSLLEVGTGFHNELTGRENIFLNGAILGMKKASIERQFDAIVDFAEVERFIDTPVKHYSSGMYLRLAFAVAAHLEPETLLVDEVLAVGDMAFQKKCIGKMGDVARTGRTVLFVSHNMGAVRSLCQKGLVMHGGRLVSYTDVGAAIETYYRLAADGAREQDSRPASGFGFGDVRILGRNSRTVHQSESFEVATTLHIGAEVSGFALLCILEDANQRGVFHLRRESSELAVRERWDGVYDVRIKLPPLWLEPGLYSLHFKVLLRGELASSRHVSDTVSLDVSGDSSGTPSVLAPRADWMLVPVAQTAPAAC